MTRKKSKKTQAKVAVNRLLEDEQVQKQLRTGALRLREAWTRASRRPFSRAVEDKKVYSKVQEAASNFAGASRSLRRKPQPQKRTGRKLAIGAALAGAVAFVLKKKRGSAETATPSYTEQTVPAPSPVAATTPNTPVTPVPAA